MSSGQINVILNRCIKFGKMFVRSDVDSVFNTYTNLSKEYCDVYMQIKESDSGKENITVIVNE